MSLHRFSVLIALSFILVAGAVSFAQSPPSAFVLARHGVAASDEPQATRIGVEILRRGGNAVDAAVAMGFALAVTLPEAGNLGGGGFMLVHLAKQKRTIAIDYREAAPAAATAEMFLDRGEPDPQKSRFGGLAVGVPGTVAGLALAHAKYGSGKFTLSRLIAPATRLARDGIEVDEELAESLQRLQARLARWPSAARIFLKPGGAPLGSGDRLVQRDLASTLEEIARGGPRAFYEGPIADKIAASVRAAGGNMTREDLASYQVKERTPVRGRYRGYEILSMPPPSSGGVSLIEILNIIEGYDLRAQGSGPAALHLMIEAMKYAYADRSEFLGDPDFVKLPVKGLMAKTYAASLRAKIDPERARPSSEIKPGDPAAFEHDHTTHYSVADRDGNAVANTYTLNFSFGLGMVAEGSGILLNNELDDFAAKAGAVNAFGLVGGARNLPGPGRRPVSSMTPVLVLREGKVFLVTGAAGGGRIISVVLQVIVNVVDFGMSFADAVAAPRVHHQWLPDEVGVERGLAAETAQGLAARGHKLAERRAGGSANSILLTPGGLAGAADPRSRSAAAAGY
jgi:gamma-glutamyltranspeptidase/glutathione hydrolase